MEDKVEMMRTPTTLPPKNAALVRRTISEWREAGLLDEAQAKSLVDSIEVIKFDWRRLAKYSFWISLACIIFSIGAVLADAALIQLLLKIFNAPPLVKCVVLSALAAGFYFIGVRRKSIFPEKIYSNEGILFLGLITTAGAVYNFGQVIDNGSNHFSILLLFSFLIYAVLGFLFQSNLIWIFALTSLGSWFGAETGYVSGWGAYYLGMNYPLRFVFFGVVLTAVTLALEKNRRFKKLSSSTLAIGLLYLFISLWIMSIFGNYGDLNAWRDIRQIELLPWALLFGVAALASLFHGLYFDCGKTKGFGLTFLFINLYTRFFEYFWDGLHKAIFFAILGSTFWFLGTRAEKIWQSTGANSKRRIR